MWASYRYRIEPSPVQRSMLARTFGCCRVAFNDAVRVREDTWQAGEKITPTEVQRRVITQAKTSEERGCRKVGRPRFKSRKDNRQSFRLTRNGFSVRPNGRLYLAKIGEVKVRWSRTLPSEPSSVTVVQEPDGHYYASFVVEIQPTPLPAVAREVGVDLGLIFRAGSMSRCELVFSPR